MVVKKSSILLHACIAAFLSFFTLTLTSVDLRAQETGRLRGVVTDSLNGEALAYGNVFIEELKTGATTDDRGYFYISSIPPNRTYNLLVSYVGYESKSIQFVVQPNHITELDVKLNPSSIELQTIEKIGQKVAEYNATDIGLERIAVKELEMMPKGVETDVFRSLQYIPGVRSTGDVSARYYVRGGESNQNLVLLNGATIYNPFHALGLFSVIDPDMVNNMEFYKGGFTSEFGGRLSSVLKLVTKDGNKNRISGTATASLLTAKGLVEGPIPYGSFIVTGRKSHNTDILKKFLNDQTAPFDFYDLSFKLNYGNPTFIPGSKFVIHGFFSGDKLKNDNPLKEDFSWSNDVLGFSWFQVYDSPLFSEINLSMSNFNGEVIPNLSSVKPRRNEVRDLTLKLDFNYIFDDRDEVAAGIHINTVDTKLYLENGAGVLTDIHSTGANLAVYAKYKLLQWEEFGADFGGRVNLAGLSKNGNFFIEPRISLTYRPINLISFKAAYGVYQQELTTISSENEVISLFEPYVIVPDYLETPRSTHYTFGVDFILSEAINLGVETYYKKLDNITSINDNKRYEEDPDLLSGDGDSYGIESQIKYSQEPISITASYALSYSYKEVEGWLYYPRYDSRHALNLTFEVNVGAGWHASAIWVFNTGLPFTPIIGYYDKLFMSDFRGPWDIYENYIPYSVLGDKNYHRLPNYHRLDLSLSKKFEFSFAKLSLDFSIINVYNRENIFYFDRSSGEQVNMLPFLPTATVKVEI